MKGIILANICNNSLGPVAQVVPCHLLPVYDRPLIYYPLSTLMQAGVREVLIVARPSDLERLKAQLGDGSQWGMAITYAEEPTRGGVAKDHLIQRTKAGESVALICGDSVVVSHDLPELIAHAASRPGASVFARHSAEVNGLGDNLLIRNALVGMPPSQKSRVVGAGLYLFDDQIAEIAGDLGASSQGVVDLGDVLRAFHARGMMSVELLGPGGMGFDVSTPEKLIETSESIRLLETGMGSKIACPEEIALHQGFISRTQFHELISKFEGSSYGKYLQTVFDDAASVAEPIATQPDEAARRKEIEDAAKAGMVPPQSMWWMVGAIDHFIEQGQAFSEYLIEHGDLNPGSSVLDIGCGLGKYAIHLAPYLSDGGRYEGFDVEWPSVEWCQLAITPRYPNATFRHTPLQSEMYSPGATEVASNFRYPYADNSFDLAFLASVFTHMFTDDVDNYIQEIGRVLKPGGRCIATFYLLNEQSRSGIANGTAVFSFSIPRDGCWLERMDPPESAVAYDEKQMVDMFASANLHIVEPTRYGAWSRAGIQDQDFMILEKR